MGSGVDPLHAPDFFREISRPQKMHLSSTTRRIICGVNHKNSFENVQFVCISKLIMSVHSGKIPLLERKKVTQ